jgi:putative heme-binding domain-containing protein
MDKIVNQKAWFLVLPVFALVAFSAILPLMTVVNYSMQDTFGNNQFFWNGVGWFKELLDPSAKINEKFQTQIFQLESGVTVTGLVVEETPSVIKVVENPLAKAAPTEIKPADVTARKKSATSIMPKGLLDKLSREEILDLVAFLHSRGKKDHAVFSGAAGGHGHGH